MTAIRPFDKIRKIFKDSVSENDDLLKYIFEKSDSISLWIIGLAIGSVSLVANNIADIQKTISPEYLKPILLLLTISVVAGIFYRSYYLYFFIVLTNTRKGLQIAFSNNEYKTMDTKSVLLGNETFAQLTDIVKSGFNEDLSYLVDAYENIDYPAKVVLYKSVVDHYLQLVELAKNEERIALEFVAETYNKFTGVNPAKFIKKLNRHNSGRHYKWTLRITMTLYIIYVLSFILALFTFVIAA